MLNDKGDINPERKFVYQRTCYAKHFGMCETADRARLPSLRKLGKRIKGALQSIRHPALGVAIAISKKLRGRWIICCVRSR